MLKNLTKLGLTPNEAKIYSTLLDLGQSSTGPIIKKTGLHRNIVYDALDNLVKEKLVSAVIKSGKKYFKIRDPQILIEQAQERLNITNRIVSQIKRELKTKAPEVVVYEGPEGWQTAYRYLTMRLKPKDMLLTLGIGGDKWVDAMGDFFITWENFLQKNKINNKMIAYEWQRREVVAHQSNPARKTKYLPQKYPIPANTEIFKDGVFIQIYTDPVVLIEISSKEVAKAYQLNFNTLWKLASD
jgi:predicted transcriptional regulator